MEGCFGFTNLCSSCVVHATLHAKHVLPEEAALAFNSATDVCQSVCMLGGIITTQAVLAFPIL